MFVFNIFEPTIFFSQKKITELTKVWSPYGHIFNVYKIENKIQITLIMYFLHLLRKVKELKYSILDNVLLSL